MNALVLPGEAGAPARGVTGVRQRLRLVVSTVGRRAYWSRVIQG
jgi:hypothetical protein